ncbi:hypothetical protein C7475_101999 [Chitinophaga sp. S165]|nr:hypothetical protein C7475_101999 [Chitinophaga sp. S165]
MDAYSYHREQQTAFLQSPLTKSDQQNLINKT